MIDYSRYFELLKSAQNLKKQGKNFFFENEKESLELSRYRVALEEHIFWKNRRQFALLMENFINGIIDGQEFRDSLSVLKRKTVEAYDVLEFEINSKNKIEGIWQFDKLFIC